MPESTRKAYGGRVGEGTDAINAQVDRLEQRVGVSSFAPLDDEQHETCKKRRLFYPLRSSLDECERVCERSVGYTRRISARNVQQSMVDVRIADLPTFNIHLVSSIQRYLRTKMIVQLLAL